MDHLSCLTVTAEHGLILDSGCAHSDRKILLQHNPVVQELVPTMGSMNRHCSRDICILVNNAWTPSALMIVSAEA